MDIVTLMIFDGYHDIIMIVIGDNNGDIPTDGDVAYNTRKCSQQNWAKRVGILGSQLQPGIKHA